MTAPVFDAAYLDNPSPAYPQLSRRMREEGRVILRVLVNPGGRADEVQVHASSGYPRLDDTARETVKQWKFVPAKRGAQPVPAWCSSRSLSDWKARQWTRHKQWASRISSARPTRSARSSSSRCS
jgi:TonB family protein